MNLRVLPLFVLFLSVILLSAHPSSKLSRKEQKEDVGEVGTIGCTACTAAISVASLILKFDASEPAVLKLATIICKLFAKQAWVVCEGISGQFKEEFFYVFRQLAGRSASEICGILLPDCADPSDPSGAGWEVALPPKPKKMRKRIRRVKDSSSRPLRVLQLSDLHIDFEYQEGAEAKCGLPVCCRPNSAKKRAVTAVPAGYWGTLADCDIPLRTLEHMLQYISENLEVDYVLMSGDYINHVDWKYTQDEHVKVLREIGQLTHKYFNTTPVYWAIGNHEGIPVNSFAPHSVEERFWPTWLYNEISNLSRPWVKEEAVDTINYRGSFSTKIIDGLRLISLNTGFCETTNFFLYLNQSDPDGTMSWLVAELYKAELAGEKVQLMAHIPPGDGECLEGWARNYYRVIQRFASTISAQFFGHVHLDYFVVFYKDMDDIQSPPISVAYAAPSATTFSELNPAFRIYNISTDGQFRVLDIENYSADIEAANSTNPPDWKLLYTAKESFQLPNLSPKSWNNLVNRLETDDDMFDSFVKYSYRTSDHECGLNCRRSMLCSMRMGHHNESLYCPSPIKKPHLKTNRVDF